MKIRGLFRSFFLCLVVFVVMGVSAPPSAQATSDCLGSPTGAVQDWKNLYPCCFDDETCEELCGDWVKGCNNYAQFAFVCVFSTTKEMLALEERVECKTQSNKESKKSCTNEIKSNQKSFTEGLRSNLEQAKETCLNCFDDCFNFCTEE